MSTESAPEAHPTAEQDLEELEEVEEDIEEERRAKARGEIELPWPGSSTHMGVIGVAALASGAAIFAWPEVETGDGLAIFAGLASMCAGTTMLLHARWLHRHFETGEQPRYGHGADTESEVAD